MAEQREEARYVPPSTAVTPQQQEDDPAEGDGHHPFPEVPDGGQGGHLLAVVAQDVGHARVAAAVIAHVVLRAMRETITAKLTLPIR